MRSSLRPPSERGSFFRRPSTGYQGPVLEGQVLAPGAPSQTRIPRTDGRERFNKSGGPTSGWAFGNLEDRIARSLGFEGKHDGGYQMAKRLARKAKISKGAYQFIVEEAAEALRKMAEEGQSEPQSAPQMTGFTPCDWSSLGGGQSGPIVGYQTLASPVCTFVTGTAGMPTVPTAGPYVAVLAPTTSQNFPASAFNQYNGYFQLSDNLHLRGMTLNAQSPAVTFRPNAMNAVDPLTAPLLKTAVGAPLARPAGVKGLGQATRESSASSYGEVLPKLQQAQQVNSRSLAITATKTGSAVNLHTVSRTPVKTGTKERKTYIKAPAVVASAMNAVTETEDFVDAFWDALPDRVKNREMARRHGKKPKFQDKAWQVWRYWHEVDLSQAMINLALNEVQDRVIGRMSRAANQNIGRYSRRPVGRTFGPAL